MSMVPRDPSVPGYDWSARVRTTALEALRYSRFVHLMKRILSLGAFLIIAAVLAFFFVQRLPHQLQMSYERLGKVDNDLAMMKPRLSGADAKGNPYVITADMAVMT
jgi:lipopolysaccharide export system protein LptC